MAKKTKILGSAFTAIVLCFLVYGYLQFQRPAQNDVSENEVFQSLSTAEILALFETDENSASALLVEKTIEVSGIIKEVNYVNDQHTILLRTEHFTRNFVMCDMSPLRSEDALRLKVGDTITLKGVCKGFLLDVIMLNCIPIHENTDL